MGLKKAFPMSDREIIAAFIEYDEPLNAKTLNILFPNITQREWGKKIWQLSRSDILVRVRHGLYRVCPKYLEKLARVRKKIGDKPVGHVKKSPKHFRPLQESIFNDSEFDDGLAYGIFQDDEYKKIVTAAVYYKMLENGTLDFECEIHVMRIMNRFRRKAEFKNESLQEGQ